MDYVKGCDIFVLSKFNLKRIADGRIVIADGLKNVVFPTVAMKIMNNLIVVKKDVK